MATSLYRDLSTFNFIRIHFLHICVRKVAVHLYEGVGSNFPRALIETWARWIFFANTFCRSALGKVAVYLQKGSEMMSTSVYTDLNPFNFIRKHFLKICVRKVDVCLYRVLEVMSTSVYTGLNSFNFIRKHFLQICVRRVAVGLYKVLEVMSTSVYTGLNNF
jgi:hypothetical protein